MVDSDERRQPNDRQVDRVRRTVVRSDEPSETRGTVQPFSQEYFRLSKIKQRGSASKRITVKHADRVAINYRQLLPLHERSLP